MDPTRDVPSAGPFGLRTAAEPLGGDEFREASALKWPYVWVVLWILLLVLGAGALWYFLLRESPQTEEEVVTNSSARAESGDVRAREREEIAVKSSASSGASLLPDEGRAHILEDSSASQAARTAAELSSLEKDAILRASSAR
ncbi:MAG: hypothetical protein A2542_02330 [Parcubacteria group bacterium RIFOXYD2_FULL_52_8]|nr:MAG: hypothetical protein A2542_02330 [Parcubacteria group bacterium RIFOXYD2_FULL_52_8]